MACLKKTDILLPAAEICKEKWAVVACDQYTSQPEYWEAVRKEVGESPSALNLIYPEVYLETESQQEAEERIEKIKACMKAYIEEGILVERVHQGFSLCVREVEHGVRIGLVAAVDLEAYDYTPGTDRPIRATEGTVESRIPPRVCIRQKAELESPHVLLLLNDAECRILEPLYAEREKLPILYDTELMQGGGRLTGYGITGELAEQVEEKLAGLEAASGGFFLAAGDGNHSLATAKACWNQIKKNLSEEEREKHPARYALAEIVNLHSPSMVFEPIHRVVFGGSMQELFDGFLEFLQKKGIGWEEPCPDRDADVIFLQDGERLGMKLARTGGRLAVDFLQQFLDTYLSENPKLRIDYIHEEDAVADLVEKEDACGILLKGMEKDALFPAVEAGGVLPRKTFSIGEAREKRYYMECRRIVG